MLPSVSPEPCSGRGSHAQGSRGCRSCCDGLGAIGDTRLAHEDDVALRRQREVAHAPFAAFVASARESHGSRGMGGGSREARSPRARASDGGPWPRLDLRHAARGLEPSPRLRPGAEGGGSGPGRRSGAHEAQRPHRLHGRVPRPAPPDPFSARSRAFGNTSPRSWPAAAAVPLRVRSPANARPRRSCGARGLWRGERDQHAARALRRISRLPRALARALVDLGKPAPCGLALAHHVRLSKRRVPALAALGAELGDAAVRVDGLSSSISLRPIGRVLRAARVDGASSRRQTE